MIEAYPLSWPTHMKRTINPERSHFGANKWRVGGHSIGYARDIMLKELDLLKAERVVISTNLRLRQDGLPYSSQREPEDKGVAVYFYLGGEEKCFAVDCWDRIADNLWAIAKSIGALRGLERWGAKDMVDAAFRGFKSLPSPDMVVATAPQWFSDCFSKQEVKAHYKSLVKSLHPDLGGDPIEFAEMKRQYDVEMSK